MGVISFEDLLKILQLFAMFVLSSASICLPPDKPEAGLYTPSKKHYLPGDRVTYFCKKGFILFGEESRTCQFSGKWTEATPFCDHGTNLKTATSSSSTLPSLSSYRIIDKNLTTCFGTKPRTGENFRVFLRKPAVIHMVRMFMPKGEINFALYTESYRNMTHCMNINTNLLEKQWLDVHCHDSPISDSIYLRDISSRSKMFEICELEVFVKDTLWCAKSPDIYIPHGWLEDITREKAALRCEDGYRPGAYTRLVCDEKGEWSGGILQCEEILCEWPYGNATSEDWHTIGSESKLSVSSRKSIRCKEDHVVIGGPNVMICLPNGTWTRSTARCEKANRPSPSSEQNYNSIIISASVVISIVFLTGFVIVVLLMKRKSKPVVVVLKQGEHAYSSVGGGESEYSTISCSTMASYQRRVDGSTLSGSTTGKQKNIETIVEDYAEPVDHCVPIYSTPSSAKYADPHKEAPVYVNQNADTLKDSPIYTSI